MSHQLPEVKLGPNDVPQPDLFNRALLPLVEKLTGRMNENDVSADARLPLSRVAANAYSAVSYTHIKANPDWANAAAWARPDTNTSDGATAGGAQDAFTIDDNPGWQAITDITQTVATGEDKLCLFAQVQYIAWLDDIGAQPTLAPRDPVRLQFAFRLDGEVLEKTITGNINPFDRPPREMYKAVPDDPAFALFTVEDRWDFRHISRIENAAGLSCPCAPVRITFTVPVMEGSHTIEVVARRVPTISMQRDNAVDSSDPETVREGSSVQVFNRLCAVLRLKGVSKSSTTAPSLSVPAYLDAEVLSQASLTTARLVAIRDFVNSLTMSALEQGALRNEHLPAATKYPNMTALNGAAWTFNATYPGWNNTAAWLVLQDAAANPLLINNGGSGNWNFSANPGLLFVLGNVRVNRIFDNAGLSEDKRLVACFALKLTNGVGGTDLVEGTEVYLNAHNENPRTGVATHENIYDNVPLLWVIDTTTLSAPYQDLASIAVVGSTHDGTETGITVRCSVEKMSLLSFLVTK